MTEVTINISEVLSHFSGPEPENVAYLLERLRIEGGRAFKKLADQIDAAYTPPRIPEPGWGSKVVASTVGNDQRRTWLMVAPGVLRTESGGVALWPALIDPELVTS